MNKKKLFTIMFIVILMVFIFTGSVAYYRYTLEGKIIASTGNAVFNVTGINNETKTIDLGNKLLPGDRGSFTITLDSTGSSVDMYATLKIDRKVLPDNLKFYSTSDHKSEIKTYYSFFEVSGTRSETITIYWYWNPFKDDDDDNKYVGKSLSADISVSAVQISEYAVMKNGGIAKSEFWNDTYSPYIRTISFGNDLSNLPSSCTAENLCWDVSNSTTQSKKVYAYLIDSGLKDSTDTTKTLYNLYIVSEAPIFAPTDCSLFFTSFKSLTQINFNNNFNTSKVTNMSLMFQDCTSIAGLDLSSFNTSNVTNMPQMFRNCSSLINLDLSGFNTSKVTSMSYMFALCSSLTSLDLNNLNTSNVTSMSSMFNGCSALTKLNLDNFNTSNVTNMNLMFQGCSSLTSLDLSSFNTSNVTNMSSMFQSCSSLTSLDLNNFNTANVTDMNKMFYACRTLTELDLSNFNTSKVTTMLAMFYNCSSLTSLDLGNFNTSNVTSMRSMFSYSYKLKQLNLSNFDTSKVTDMSGMFMNCSKLQTQINIMNANMSSDGYVVIFVEAATDANAKITVNYTAETSNLVDQMLATIDSTNNVVKGNQI